jgi:hypothetical protein
MDTLTMAAPGSNIPTQIGGVPAGVGAIHNERNARRLPRAGKADFLSGVSYFTLVSNLMAG